MRILPLLLFLVMLTPARAKTVYLTFDDGPIKGTEEVLDTLKALDVKATFFVVGNNQGAAGGKDKQRALFARMLKEGHKVGNHTFTHSPKRKEDYDSVYPKPLSEDAKANFRQNFDKNQAHFRELVADQALTFRMARLPGDGGNKPSLKYLRDEVEKLGMKHHSWTFEFAPNGVISAVKSNDWQGIKGVAATYPTMPEDNAIILFHDSHWSAKAGLLKQVIKHLSDNGYSFALVSE